MFVLNQESTHHYRVTLEAIAMLKRFYDMGVDVNKHAKSYNLHVAGSYNTNGSDLCELFEMLAPLALPNSTFLPAQFYSPRYVTTDEETEIEEKKRRIVMDMADATQEFPFIEYTEFNTLAMLHYEGDFSMIDKKLVQEAAYPMIFEYSHLFDSNRLEHYKKWTKVPNNESQIETEDGVSCYICINNDKTQLALMFDLDDYWWRMEPIAAALGSIVKQVQMARTREDN